LDQIKRWNVYGKIACDYRLTRRLDTFAVRASADGLTTERWTEYVSDEKAKNTVKCSVDMEVMALRGFACWGDDGSEPPCTQIFHLMNENHCERELDALLTTKIMQATVNYKWSVVQGRVHWRMLIHMVYWLLIIATISISTQSKVSTSEWHGVSGTDWSVPDVLQVIQAVMTTGQLIEEARQYQIARTNRDYWTDLWNWMDLTSIAVCYIACAGHFTQSDDIESQVGSVAVLLVSFGFLQRLRPLTGTGPLIQTILIIAEDIQHFCIVLVVLMLGFGNAFAASMPASQQFNSGGKAWGWWPGMLTTYTSMLGAFDQHDYTTLLGQVYFVLFLALVLIVMLNLLIAIMSSVHTQSFSFLDQSSAGSFFKKDCL